MDNHKIFIFHDLKKQNWTEIYLRAYRSIKSSTGLSEGGNINAVTDRTKKKQKSNSKKLIVIEWKQLETIE